MCVSLTGIIPSPRTWTPLPHCTKVPGIHVVPFTRDLYSSLLFINLQVSAASSQPGIACFTADSTIHWIREWHTAEGFVCALCVISVHKCIMLFNLLLGLFIFTCHRRMLRLDPVIL